MSLISVKSGERSSSQWGGGHDSLLLPLAELSTSTEVDTEEREDAVDDEQTVRSLLFGELGRQKGDELHLCTTFIVSILSVHEPEGEGVTHDARTSRPEGEMPPDVREKGGTSQLHCGPDRVATYVMRPSDEDVLESGVGVHSEAVGDGPNAVGTEGAFGVDVGDLSEQEE